MSTDDLGLDLIAETRRNWQARGLEQVDAMVAATSIARAHQIVLSRINQTLTGHDLTFSRYEALALLSFARNQSMGMARMGERLQVHPTSVTSTIDRLERDGLVARKPNPDDRRATLVELTSEGVELLEQATTSLEAVRWGMEQIPNDSLEKLSTGLSEVRNSVGDASDDATNSRRRDAR